MTSIQLQSSRKLKGKKILQRLLSIPALLFFAWTFTTTAQDRIGDNSYYTFGRSQLYSSGESLWLFLDIDEVSNGSGSEGQRIIKKGFSALNLSPESTKIWRSCNPGLSASKADMSFVQISSKVYGIVLDDFRWNIWKLSASRRHLSGVLAWRFEDTDGVTTLKAMEQSEISHLIKHQDATIPEKSQILHLSELTLIDAANYGYGEYPPLPYKLPGGKVGVEFVATPRKLGWQNVTVTQTPMNVAPCRTSISVNELVLPESQSRNKKERN